ncbi:MAG TPA: DUF2868 domain-containing protein [Noviherbaspirillum sp.]|uniref:DUF2868 domain-containing protein n=1 Tax=Noviherbaspirillum sp. TaxID=1926288 RepID=UPI002F93DC67
MNDTHRLEALLVAETVRLIEAEAPFDDTEANRHAAAAGGDREHRLLARAAILGRRLGLQQQLQSMRARAAVAWALLAGLVFLVGVGLVQGLLGDGRTINAMLAFTGALGMHFLTLALWLLGLLSGAMPGAAFAPATARLSFGNLLLRLAARRGGRHGARQPQLLAAVWSMLGRARMLPWVFGLVSHTVWSAAFVLALAGLWFMFSFREYRLTWETTIQSSQFFIGFIDTSGQLPRMLGFPTPGTADLAGGGAGAQRALAWWLMGCVFTYGLLPRLLLAAVSAMVVAHRRARLRLDTADPYYRTLLARIDEMGRTVVVDPDRTTGPAVAAMPVTAAGDERSQALVGFELPPDADWPPPGLGQAAALSVNVSGAGDQLREALDRLGLLRPARILVVCNQAASPDRGTARFLRQAAACGGSMSLLLLPVRGGDATHVRRWKTWLADSGLEILRPFEDAGAASAWLEGCDE